MTDALVELLRDGGPRTVGELAERLGRFRSTTFSALVELEQAGRVERVGRGRWAVVGDAEVPS